MIPLPATSGKTYLILGYGKSGQTAAAALKASGAAALVWDDNETAQVKAQADGFTLADSSIFEARKLDGLVVAPGILPDHPARLAAHRKKVPVISDLTLLFQAQPEATFIGVTGTNGKSTTTALIAHILNSAGRKVQMGGNIGIAALSLDPLGKDGFYVLEMSSYQLDLTREHSLNVGVLLNITPDHIDHHGSMESYIAAKAHIAQPTTSQTLIIGTDEAESAALFKKFQKKKNLTLLEISTHPEVAHGARLDGRKLHLSFDPQPVDLTACKSLLGAHNVQNAAAAFLACHALDLSRREIERGMQSFAGLAHRQQLVATLGGVRFVNDSKATNADAASKALVCYDTIYWIIGGRPKSGGLGGLENLLATVRHAFIIGEASDDFAAWCKGKIPFACCGTLEVAVQKAAAMAWHDKIKDACVLLSPACASFDQFTSFEARGDTFAALVHTLKPEM